MTSELHCCNTVTVQMASSTMGLELCGRRDKGSIWGPAVLPCNATLKYKYTAENNYKDKYRKIQKGIEPVKQHAKIKYRNTKVVHNMYHLCISVLYYIYVRIWDGLTVQRNMTEKYKRLQWLYKMQCNTIQKCKYRITNFKNSTEARQFISWFGESVQFASF